MTEQEKELLWTQKWYLDQLDLEHDQNARKASEICQQLLGVSPELPEPESPEIEPEPDGGHPVDPLHLTIKDHWVEQAIREPVSGGRSMETRRLVINHFTAGATAMSSIEYWRETGAASCHFVVARDGTIYQCRALNRSAGHAGKAGSARWVDPKTGVKYQDLNNCSIGIEFANGGSTYPTRFSDLDPITARPTNGGPSTDWERFTEAQLQVAYALNKLLVDTYNLDDCVGHENVTPERRNDPGPAFPMTEIREHCGFEGPAVTHRK